MINRDKYQKFIVIVIPVSLSWVFLSAGAYANQAGLAPAETSDQPAAEQMLDIDLTDNLAAEALPVVNRFAFGWETVRFAAVQALTLNTERKAERYELRLHQLDRKMAACAAIGDSACTQRIKERITTMEDRTRRYMSRHQELRDRLQEKFETWRQNRQEYHTEWQQQAVARRSQQQELLEQRRQLRRESQTNRRQKIQQVQKRLNAQDERLQLLEQRQDSRQDLRNTPRQNQEKLIELRSLRVKNELNNTREHVEQRQSELEAIEQ
ncbi:MAG: hypothetical protein COT71_04240 [Candidatus Andersenbacteria bacterium CG10_big_fil_rev_8_21_14_0_10_54_11]|uniref:Uncharacterized protein n=1 Tax=Candidatus Andersenbacteria bacterium CG10_big_fil_rev_8_21_14_0_10_54_11 TaxID=1974485 RepID=A0A2M6WYE4_9BACT|nr:MAG: hypothetical protein COT71_04240 [Candidatus Andersenbacteria bacterium CG10_big_fil_rev_8_21_14_0_10_54_11]